jgi:hypothetical protein
MSLEDAEPSGLTCALSRARHCATSQSCAVQVSVGRGWGRNRYTGTVSMFDSEGFQAVGASKQAPPGVYATKAPRAHSGPAYPK